MIMSQILTKKIVDLIISLKMQDLAHNQPSEVAYKSIINVILCALTRG